MAARQRFIHPDIWTDPSLGMLRSFERLLFIGCFSNADDEGRLLGSPAYLRATVFPYDDLSLEEVKVMRDNVIEKCKNLVLYVVNDLEYLAFMKWSKYQKPKYPKPSKLPAPPDKEIGESFTQNSGKVYPETEKASVPRLGLDRDGMDRDDVDDDRAREQKNPAQVWEQETGRPLSPISIQEINAYITDDGLEVDVVIEAMKRAVLHGHVNLKYVDGIIKNWIANKVKTLADIARIDAEFEQKQKRKQTKPTARSPGPEYEDLTKRWRNEGVIPDG